MRSGSTLAGANGDPAVLAGGEARDKPPPPIGSRRGASGAARCARNWKPSRHPALRRAHCERWRAARDLRLAGHGRTASQPSGHGRAAAIGRAVARLRRLEDQRPIARIGRQRRRVLVRTRRDGYRARPSRPALAALGDAGTRVASGPAETGRSGDGRHPRHTERRSRRARTTGRSGFSMVRLSLLAQEQGRRNRRGVLVARRGCRRRSHCGAGSARKCSPHRARASARWGRSCG